MAGHWRKVLLGGAMVATWAVTVPAVELGWLSTDLPPASFEADGKQQGYSDLLVQELFSTLPQHTVRWQRAPFKRMLATLQQGSAYCSAILLDTPERRSYLRFTRPYGYILPNGLVIRRADQSRFAPYLNERGEVSLTALLADARLRVGLVNGRAYGPVVDRLLTPITELGAPRVRVVFPSDGTRYLLRMLQHNRVDFLPAYATEVRFYATQPEMFQVLPISEAAALMPVRLACTRAPAIDQLFGELDASLTPARLARHHALYERWLLPEQLDEFRSRLAQLPR